MIDISIERGKNSQDTFKSMNDFKAAVFVLRKARKLHPLVREVIATIFRKNFPKCFIVPETAKFSSGHRADLIVRLPTNETVHFEIFADARMVSNDVNCFENSPAKHKISVIMDDEVDKRVADKYFHELDSRKLPYDIYHEFCLSDILVEGKQQQFISRLKEIIFGSERKVYLNISQLRLPAGEWYVARENTENVAMEVIQRLKQKNPVNLFVTGPRGVGKSSFLNRFKEMLSSYRVYCLKREIVDERWDEFLDELIADCKEFLKQRGFSIPSDKTSRSDTVIQLLVEIEKKVGSIAVVIDRFERIVEMGESRVTEAELERVWDSLSRIVALSQSPSKVAWVISARQQYFFLVFPNFSALTESNFTYLNIGLMNHQESSALLNKICEVTGYELSEEAKRILLENTNNHPQNIILSFVNLCYKRTKKAKISREEIFQKRPWKDLLENDLKRLETKAQRLALFAMADASKEISTFQEIARKVNSELNLSEDELKDVLRQIQNRTNLVEEPRKSIFQFYHPRIGDLIRERFGEEFPKEWNAEKLAITAIYMLEQGEYDKGYDIDWYWYPVPNLIVKTLVLSSSYEWTVWKALDIVRKTTTADLEKGGDTEDKTFKIENDVYHFLRVLIEIYMSAGKPDIDLLDRLKDKLLDVAKKSALGLEIPSEKVWHLCFYASEIKKTFKDEKRAEKLIAIASRIIDSRCFSGFDRETAEMMRIFNKRGIAERILKKLKQNKEPKREEST